MHNSRGIALQSADNIWSRVATMRYKVVKVFANSDFLIDMSVLSLINSKKASYLY